VTTKPSPDGSLQIYPYVKVEVTPAPLHLCVHEPLLWRLADFARHLEFAEGSAGTGGTGAGSSSGSGGGGGGTGGGVGGGGGGGGGGGRAHKAGGGAGVGKVDVGSHSDRADMPLLIGLMRVSPVRLRLSFRAAPEGRPRRAPRVLSSGPLSVANLDDMPLDLRSLTVQSLHSRGGAWQIVLLLF
jgi:hypothetical protein